MTIFESRVASVPFETVGAISKFGLDLNQTTINKFDRDKLVQIHDYGTILQY